MSTAYYASIDLGGTNIAGAIADAHGTIVADETTPTHSHEGPDGVLKRICSLVQSLSKRAGVSVRWLGVGVPGLVDVERGITKFLPNMPTQWRDIHVADKLGGALGCGVSILNDARTAALGELTFGAGREASVNTMVFFTLGTGVGGAVIVNRQLRLGPLGAAGELGHQTILPDGPRCGCGNYGCLEALASGPAITGEGVRLLRSGLAPKLHELTGGDVSAVTTKTMAQAALAGDVAVADAIRRAAGFLGIGAANMVVALHPELIVLAGGVSLMGAPLLDEVRRVVRLRADNMVPVSSVRIEVSQLGDRAGVMGGIALAMQSDGKGKA